MAAAPNSSKTDLAYDE